MTSWCSCAEPDVPEGNCPFHDAPGANRFTICDVCTAPPHRRTEILKLRALNGRGTLALMSGDARAYDDPVFGVGPPAIEAVTFFRDGFQYVQHEVADFVFCPEHRMTLTAALPRVFGGQRSNDKRRKRGKRRHSEKVG